MSIGWFDFFRDHGAPSSFAETAVPFPIDLRVALLLSAFAVPSIAFLCVLPGVRRFRFASAASFLFTMTVGATILVSLHYPCWQRGQIRLFASYRAFSDARIDAQLGVKIGLNSVNVTLISRDVINPMDFNERFDFNDVSEFDKALRKGIPYPLLKVVEYLCIERNGFLWGQQFRLAGYYAYVFLWISFAIWTLQLLFLCILPHKFGPTAIYVGAFVLTADIIYALNTPRHLAIRFPSPDGGISVLEFRFAHCFYATAIAGISSILIGCALWLAQSYRGFIFETVFSTHFDPVYACKHRLSTVESPALSTSSSTASCHSTCDSSDYPTSTSATSALGDSMPSAAGNGGSVASTEPLDDEEIDEEMRNRLARVSTQTVCNEFECRTMTFDSTGRPFGDAAARRAQRSPKGMLPKFPTELEDRGYGRGEFERTIQSFDLDGCQVFCDDPIVLPVVNPKR